MKTKSILLITLAASALAIGSARANVIVAYGVGGAYLSLFSDTGTKILDYSTTLVNAQSVVTDNSGHVYVSSYGTPGAYDGSVKMYDIASGAYIRDVITAGANFTGLAFNPAKPDEIIVVGLKSGLSQLAHWDTGSTDTISAGTENSTLWDGGGVPPGYWGLYYNPTTSGLTTEGVYAAINYDGPPNLIQRYNSTTSAYETNIGIGGDSLYNPRAITGIGTDLFVARPGFVSKLDSSGLVTNIIETFDTNSGITNDGTKLWVSQYTGAVAQWGTDGTLDHYFLLTAPTGIAYTTLGNATASYSTWAAAYAAGTPPLSDTASTADPDGDGLVNAMEYALGLDPRFSSTSPGVASNSGKTITFTKGAEAKINGTSPIR
jgi:hypothetical protein